ncbi:hypothetical protein EJB05_02468, partial [Eragrostis curvula]
MDGWCFKYFLMLLAISDGKLAFILSRKVTVPPEGWSVEPRPRFQLQGSPAQRNLDMDQKGLQFEVMDANLSSDEVQYDLAISNEDELGVGQTGGDSWTSNR